MRGVKLFCLIAFSYSWIIFIIVDIFILPGLFRAGDTAKVWLIALFGHMLAMAGPALASAILWKFYHKEHFPRWKWSRPKYYLLAAGSMLAIWTLPSLLGLIFGNTLSLRSPVETFAWVVIGASFSIGWLAGLGEETGWTAYLLPRLAPRMGKSRALIAAGMIRGLWHIPVLIGPRVAQNNGRRNNNRQIGSAFRHLCISTGCFQCVVRRTLWVGMVQDGKPAAFGMDAPVVRRGARCHGAYGNWVRRQRVVYHLLGNPVLFSGRAVPYTNGAR